MNDPYQTLRVEGKDALSSVHSYAPDGLGKSTGDRPSDLDRTFLIQESGFLPAGIAVEAIRSIIEVHVGEHSLVAIGDRQGFVGRTPDPHRWGIGWVWDHGETQAL